MTYDNLPILWNDIDIWILRNKRFYSVAIFLRYVHLKSDDTAMHLRRQMMQKFPYNCEIQFWMYVIICCFQKQNKECTI
jgi:hypothetical protein